jgi:hypothetical protein
MRPLVKATSSRIGTIPFQPACLSAGPMNFEQNTGNILIRCYAWKPIENRAIGRFQFILSRKMLKYRLVPCIF